MISPFSFLQYCNSNFGVYQKLIIYVLPIAAYTVICNQELDLCFVNIELYILLIEARWRQYSVRLTIVMFFDGCDRGPINDGNGAPINGWNGYVNDDDRALLKVFFRSQVLQ